MSPDKSPPTPDKPANEGRKFDQNGQKYLGQRTFSAERQAFEEATAPLKFTKDFMTALEAVIGDEQLTIGQRVLAWVKRRAWGNYSLFAVTEPDGPTAIQRDCADELGVSRQRISDAIAYFEHRGYIEVIGKRLHPVIRPELRMPDPSDPDNPELKKFMEWWKSTCTADYQAFESTRTEYNRQRKVQAAAYKQWRDSRTNSAPSLSESLRVNTESNNNNDLSVEEDPASPQKSVVVVPPFPLKESLIAFLQGLPIPTSIPPGLPAEILYHLPNEQALGMFMEAVNRQQPRSWAFPFLKVAKSCAARQPTYTPPPADLPPGVDAEQFRRLCERHGIPT